MGTQIGLKYPGSAYSSDKIPKPQFQTVLSGPTQDVNMELKKFAAESTVFSSRNSLAAFHRLFPSDRMAFSLADDVSKLDPALDRRGWFTAVAEFDLLEAQRMRRGGVQRDLIEATQVLHYDIVLWRDFEKMRGVVDPEEERMN